MLKPLYSPHCVLVGWIDTDNGNIFDLGLAWVAFISNGNIWSSRKLIWLGVSTNKITCNDKEGKVVAWNPEYDISNTVKPMKPILPVKPFEPMKPLKPIKPVKPLEPIPPIGGWSELTFNKFINQE